MRDRADGRGTHTLELRWHFPPRFQQKGPWFTSDTGSGVGIVGAEAHDWKARFENGFWSPAYGHKEAAPVLSVSRAAKLPQSFVTLLVPRLHSNQDIGILEKLQVQNSFVEAYRYHTLGEEYFLVFGNDNQPWSVGPCTSDAEFLCFGIHQDGRRELTFCSGHHVEIAGKPIVSSAELVQRCELICDGNGTQMFSSAQAGIALPESLGHISFERAGTTVD